VAGGAKDEEKDIFETDFEVPALEDNAGEDGSEAVALEDADTDLESDGFEFDPEAEDLGDKSQVVAIDEQEDAESVVAEVEEEDEVEEEEEDSEFELTLDDKGEPAASKADAVAPARARRSATAAPRRRVGRRRATVRYYNRMNPQRVFPMMVIISKQMIERMVKEQVDQKTTGPFKVRLDTAIEVEPVLPGCSCYPPRVTTRLTQQDLSLPFHVVPNVVGEIPGACVLIRQGHATLAKVDLDIRVVQRTWVVLGGALTVCLPFLSALARHFQLDFALKKEDAFNLYVMAVDVLFRNFSPLALTLGLAAITFALYWLTRPTEKDVFWDFTPIDPGAKLKEIAALVRTDPDRAGADLMYLLSAHPRFQPARLFFAEWHYKLDNFDEALKSYEKAFALGRAPARHYLLASLAASRRKHHGRALKILQDAEALLPPAELTGTMLFNMGCYHCRQGRATEALRYLRRAVAAGFRKLESFRRDADLNSLRGRPEFDALLVEIEKAQLQPQ
jgi:hypothetical protein